MADMAYTAPDVATREQRAREVKALLDVLNAAILEAVKAGVVMKHRDHESYSTVPVQVGPSLMQLKYPHITIDCSLPVG